MPDQITAEDARWQHATAAALATLAAAKLETNAELNRRMRVVRAARGMDPARLPVKVEHLIRAPLAGLNGGITLPNQRRSFVTEPRQDKPEEDA